MRACAEGLPHMSATRLAVCEYCDAVHERRPLAEGEVADCQRCGAELYRNRRIDLDRMLALVLTGLVLFAIANLNPIVEMELQGVRRSVALWGAVLATYDAGVGPVAVAAAVMLFFFPLMQLLGFLYVLLPLRAGWRPRHFLPVMHLLRHLRPWSMVEVFMLGILVAVVKLATTSIVTPTAGLWGFAALTLVLTALTAYRPQELWDLAPEDSR